MNVGFTNCSNIRLARTRDRWDEFMYYAGIAETIDVPVRLLTPEQLKEVWPLCETDGILGAIQHPDDGYIQPADLTQALAKGARDRGATIHRNTAVTAIEQAGDGKWRVVTDKGDIVADHVVSCTGNFARRTGAMVGLNVPVIPVEHQYIVTEPHPAIVERKKQGLPEMGVLRESDSSWYMREENGGLLLGPYEKGAPGLLRRRPVRRVRIRAVPGGSGAVDAAYRGGHRPRAGVRRGRHQEGLQWRHRLHSGRLADRRPGTGAEELLAQRGPFLRRHRRRRRRLADRRMDRRRRADHRHDGRRSAPLRALCDGGLPQGEERGGLCQRLHHALSGRGAGSGAAAEDDALLLPHEGTRRRVRLGLRLGAAELVRSRRLRGAQGGARRRRRRVDQREPCAAAGGWPHRREVVVPPLQLFRPCRQRGPQRHATMSGLQDMSAFAKAWVGGAGAEAWLESILANRIPKKVGRIALCHLLTRHGGVKSRVHRLPAARRLLSGLRRCLRGARPRRPAKARCRPTAASTFSRSPRNGACWFSPVRTAARCSASSRARRLDNASFPLAVRQADLGRRRHCPCAQRQLRRRARLGAPSSDRAAELHLRHADGGGSRVRHQAVRHPRHDGDGRSRRATG